VHFVGVFFMKFSPCLSCPSGYHSTNATCSFMSAGPLNAAILQIHPSSNIRIKYLISAKADDLAFSLSAVRNKFDLHCCGPVVCVCVCVYVYLYVSFKEIKYTEIQIPKPFS
jgi:hypothetical protein